MQDNTIEREQAPPCEHYFRPSPSYELTKRGKEGEEKRGFVEVLQTWLTRDEYTALERHLWALWEQFPSPTGEVITQDELRAVMETYLLVERMAHRLRCRIDAGATIEAGPIRAGTEGVNDFEGRLTGAEVGSVFLDWADMLPGRDASDRVATVKLLGSHF